MLFVKINRIDYPVVTPITVAWVMLGFAMFELERARARVREWRIRNLEKARAQSRETMRKQYREHPEKNREARRRYEEAHPGRRKQQRIQERVKRKAAWDPDRVQRRLDLMHTRRLNAQIRLEDME